MSRASGGYGQALALLESRGFGIKPDLARIEMLVELLDHPERTYPVIHLAGTNGKSSTARMIGWVLAAHGIKAGVYTSPHLQTVRERFLMVGSEGGSIVHSYISPEDFAATMTYLMPYVEEVENRRGQEVSYFELTTAMGFEWTSNSSVGVGVFEAGMGGTWDATNVVRSDLAVITRVAVDHIGFLGTTPVENAREKAGIIKEGVPLVCGPQQPDVLELLEDTASRRGTKPARFGRDFHLRSDRVAAGGRTITVEGAYGSYEDLLVSLHGGHQSVNATVAIAACEQFLGRRLDETSVRTAFAAVESPGRLEVVRSSPLVVLDGAHNPDGAKALARALPETFGPRSTTLVIAISKDKDIEGILDHLLPLARRAIFTASDEKPADPDLVATSARGKIRDSAVNPSIPDAIDDAIASCGPEDMVVVTGSLYALGPARDHLLGKIM